MSQDEISGEPVEIESTTAEETEVSEQLDSEQMRRELADLRESIDRLNTGFNSIPRRFLVGVATGLGTVVGATIVVSILVFLLRPLANIEMFRPSVESVIEMMDEERERKDAERSLDSSEENEAPAENQSEASE